MAVTTLEELRVLITAETKGLRKELDLVKMQLDGTHRSVAKSTAGITSSLKKLGLALAGAFAVRKIAQFGSAAIRTASELESAMLGLQSILEGQGRSFNKANGFIQGYIEDGLVPLTDAVTAYKNLAARGYDDEQIRNVMERLKDSAAFGRQASYTLGQAVASATEGLKNENSILVDNAGVTKNVAKMWDEYAKSIGKNAQQLTQQEKIQAEVNGIMQETRFQVGDAAKYADTYAGRLAALNKTLSDVRTNIGQAFMPIANVVLPLLQSMANALARVTAFISQFMQALFGSNKAAAQGAKQVTDAHAGIGDEIEASGKKAKGAVAGFDEINQLADPAEGAGSGASGPDLGGLGLDVENEGGVIGGALSDISTKAQEMADKVRGAFSSTKDAIVSNKDIIVPALGAVAGALAGLAIYSVASSLPSLTKVLQGIGTAASASWKALLANPMLLVAVAIGAVIGALVTAYRTNEQFRDTVDKLWERIKGALTPVLERLGAILTWLWQSVVVPLGRIIADVLVIAFQGLLRVVQWLWEYVLAPLGRFVLDSLVPTFLKIADVVGFIFKEAVEDIIFTIEFLWYDVLKPLLLWLGDTFGPVFETVGEGIKEVIEGLQTTFDGLIKFITGVFTGDWRKAWEGVKQIFKGIFDSLWGIVKVSLNLIIDGINWVIGGLNKLKITIPDWVKYVPGLSGLAGQSWGVNIKDIPRLAEGGITNGPMLAMVGDNPGGREVVSPLSDLKDIIASAVGTAVLQVMQVGGGSQSDSGRPVILYLDDKEVARGIIPALDAERNRVGGQQVVIKQV